MTRAIGYLRVSTDVQAEHGLGLQVQRERVRDLAGERGFELVELVEEAASGGVRDGELFSWEHRPRLLELLERARAGEFERLLVAKLDRLSRDYATLMVLERMLAQHGVEVVSAAEQNGDGPVAEYLRGNLALVAELERATIRERLNAGKAAGRKLGRHVEGRLPYGYRRGDDRALVPDPEHAEVVRRIFRAAAKGAGYSAIARELNLAGVAAPAGGQWRPRAVLTILRNDVYAGERHGVKRAHLAIVSRRLMNTARGRIQA